MRSSRALECFHADVDQRAGDLARRHAGRLQCRRGCSSCCVDDLTVFPIEADRIRRAHADLLREGRPHPRGACAFLDEEGACRVYEDRPYVCRTQGLPLRWFDENEQGEPIELRDICPMNDVPDEPLEELAGSACWTIGPFEGRLAGLEAGGAERGPRRIRLRSLFEREPGRRSEAVDDPDSRPD